MVGMDKAQDIARLVEDTVAALGVELWGVDYAPRAHNSLVRLYIDHPERDVTVEDCEAVSREVSALFDVNDPVRGQYTLEVSSPGLDRPFFKAAQLARFAGETVEATLHAPVDGRRRIQGVIEGVEGERVTLATGAGTFSFEFGQAAKIRIKPDYAKLLGQQSGRGRNGAGGPGDTQ
jgi:ribosome maturation factor RimP